MKAIAGSQQAHDCYAQHFAEFVYGRDFDMTNARDSALITQAGAQTMSAPSTKSMLAGLVASDLLLNRAP